MKPPPIPLLCGFVIPRQNMEAMAASIALPPLIRILLQQILHIAHFQMLRNDDNVRDEFIILEIMKGALRSSLIQ